MTDPSVDRAARQDIAEVLIRYASGIDRRDWELFRTCFTDDCRCDYGEIGVWSGVDAITDSMTAAHAVAGHTMHRVMNPAIEVSGDRATARSYVDAVIMVSDGDSGFHAMGYYDDELVRGESGWQIAERRFTMVHLGAIGGPDPVPDVVVTTTEQPDAHAHSTFAERYGPWAVVAGASVGIGAEFCRQIAAAGVNVVLVSRSVDKLDALAAELRDAHGVDTRVAGIDLAASGAESELFAATDGLEIGLLVYNAGADSLNTYFLDAAAEEWHGMLRRNCTVPLLASHRYGAAMAARKRGAILLVTSGAAWAGGSRLTTYGGTKAFDLVFAEGLWAELRRDGVDVLSLVVGATDTPALRASLAKFGVSMEDLSQMAELADPADVAREGLARLGDGPTWQVGMADGAGPSLLGSLPRREAVELMTQGHDALFGD